MPTAQAELKYARVILDDNVDRPLDYAIPDHLLGDLTAGMRVRVPLRTTQREGIIMDLLEQPEVAKALPITEKLSDRALIPPELFQLAKWMHLYYAAPFSTIIRSILPPAIRKGMPPKMQLFAKPLISRNEMAALCSKLQVKSSKQALVLQTLIERPQGLFLSELLEKSGVTASPIQTLAKQQIIQLQEVAVDRTSMGGAPLDFFPTQAKKLSDEQQICLNALTDNLNSTTFNTFLLHGITGSGKTEVYMQAIEHAIKLQKGVILLVPEIALTSQTMDRLRARFREKIALLHCRLSEGEKRDSWELISKGEVQIVVGARSALFSPVQNIGLIIVDEEHEGSYKQQEEMPCYHARDLCVMRGKLTNATVLLGSATPTLESYTNALKGKYKLLTLTHRPQNAQMAKTTIVDMRLEQEKNGGFTLFSSALISGIKKRLAAGEQTLLFLNRRGYHTTQLCTACGETVGCPHCSVSLTFHKSEEKLSCHLCGFILCPPPRNCPSCHSDATLRFKGIGTQQVESAIHALFPEIRTVRLDADTTRHKGSHDKLISKFRSGKADLLIGTQMVAKGLHFPACTLVGILSADSILNIPDFRSAEQLFQLTCQVSGRSGRSELPGEVIIQTLLPDNSTLAFASKEDYLGFYNSEIESRQFFNYPPFSHLAKLIFTGENETQVQEKAELFRTALKRLLPPTFELQPLLPCGYAKIKDTYRFHCLIKGPSILPISKAYLSLRHTFRNSKALRILLDIDPSSTFF